MVDYSTPEGKALFEREVKRRMEGPARMDREVAEMLTAVLLWEPPIKSAARTGDEAMSAPDASLQEIGRLSRLLTDEKKDNARLRAALMWVFDRMSLAVGSSEGMTVKEQRDTHREVGHALMGRTSRATKHKPNDWDPSAELMRVHQQCPQEPK